jgi:hypothetical protein
MRKSKKVRRKQNKAKEEDKEQTLRWNKTQESTVVLKRRGSRMGFINCVRCY